MTRGNDKNNHLKGIPFQNFFSGGGSSFKFRLSNLFHFKKKASWEHVNFHSACYTKRLPSQALDVTPGLISSASGLNQVHAWLLKEPVLIPRSGTRLTFSSRLLIASRHTPGWGDRGRSDMACLLWVSHITKPSLGSFPQRSRCEITSAAAQCIALSTRPAKTEVAWQLSSEREAFQDNRGKCFIPCLDSTTT